MKNRYYLQELYIIDGKQYWYDIIYTDDFAFVKRLKDVYKAKNKWCIYRVLEVKY